MSEIESEDFLSRWSRLKHESESAVPDKLPDVDAPPVAASDPAVLPSLESIVADSDIRPFLDAHVPPELTSAALRRAWAADPVIRDFIGIAENQWDFNDHAAMPGFGPLQATDYLVDQALGRLIHGAQVTPESPDAVGPPLPSPEPRSAEPADEIARLAVAPPDDSPLPAHQGLETAGVEAMPGPPAARSHGGALPK
jgi:hypothetical protein